MWYNFIKTIMANNNNIIIPIFHGAQLEQFLRFSTVMFLGPKSGAQGRRSTEKKKKIVSVIMNHQKRSTLCFSIDSIVFFWTPTSGSELAERLRLDFRAETDERVRAHSILLIFIAIVFNLCTNVIKPVLNILLV